MRTRSDPHITAEQAREIFDYSLVTGRMHRRIPSNRRPAGSGVGRTSKWGYLHVTVGGRNGRDYLVHRLAWLMVTGEWPHGEIDHIDGNKQNNAWHNLRDVDRAVNSQNMKLAKSTSGNGLLGVHWHAHIKKWAARITVHSKTRYLGSFTTKEEAHEAYLAAKRRLHPGCTI